MGESTNKFKDAMRSFGIMFGTVGIAGVIFYHLGEHLTSGQAKLVAIVIFIAAVAGDSKRINYGWWQYRATYLGIMLAIPMLLVTGGVKYDVDESFPSSQQTTATNTPSAQPLTKRNRGGKWLHHEPDSKKAAWVMNGQDYVAQRLRDPDSAKFRNMFFANISAPVSCGEVNGKNALGAYTGYVRYVTGNRSDLTFLESDLAPGEFAKVWAELCGK